jgi:prevent-host-death family protein
MKQVNIHAAKTHLSRLVEEAIQGETVVLAKAGKPMVVLTPYLPGQKPRQGGQLHGQISSIPEDFDAPSAQIEALFNE